eukprot:765187-Hanusia_phi.AAC.1
MEGGRRRERRAELVTSPSFCEIFLMVPCGQAGGVPGLTWCNVVGQKSPLSREGRTCIKQVPTMSGFHSSGNVQMALNQAITHCQTFREVLDLLDDFRLRNKMVGYFFPAAYTCVMNSFPDA